MIKQIILYLLFTSVVLSNDKEVILEKMYETSDFVVICESFDKKSNSYLTKEIYKDILNRTQKKSITEFIEPTETEPKSGKILFFNVISDGAVSSAGGSIFYFEVKDNKKIVTIYDSTLTDSFEIEYEDLVKKLIVKQKLHNVAK